MNTTPKSTNQAVLAINPNWPTPGVSNVVVYAQAWHTARQKQRVTITGAGLKSPIVKESDPGTPFGTQFLNQLIKIDQPLPPFPNWRWQVQIDYSPDGGRTWQGSNVKGSNTVSVLEDTMQIAFALSNDGGGDTDYNDTVVQISAFNNSTDTV